MEGRDGWIKIYRQLEDSPIWGNPRLVYFWIWCLIQADIEAHETLINGHVVKMKPGQFIFGRKSAAQKTKLGESTVYRYIQLLEKLKMVNRKVNSRYTLVTIVNWRKFQGDIEKVNSQMNSRETASRTERESEQIKKSRNPYKSTKNRGDEKKVNSSRTELDAHIKNIGGAKSSPPDGVELRSPDVAELPVDEDGNFVWGDEE